MGIGVEAQRVHAPSLTVGSSSTGTTFSPQIQPGIYARVVGAIGHPISENLDVLARLSLHIEPSGLEGGLENDFASATVGLRLRLP